MSVARTVANAACIRGRSRYHQGREEPIRKAGRGVEEQKEQAKPTATEAASSWAATQHTTPVEPLEHLVSEEDIRRGEQAGARRSKDPGFLRFFVILNGGLILTALAIVLFKTPNHFAFGGTSGVSVILSTLFPTLPVGAFMWIINIVLVALGFIFLERKAILWSVFASFALSGYVSLFEMLFPGASTTSITGDMWLDLCFAVILPAIGSAMVFDIGASTGGTDILAMILKRHSTLEIGRALLLVDIGIVCIAAVLYGPRVGLYCVLGLFAKTLVVDKAIESIHLRKVCTIICKEPLKVETYIVKELNRHGHHQPWIRCVLRSARDGDHVRAEPPRGREAASIRARGRSGVLHHDRGQL